MYRHLEPDQIRHRLAHYGVKVVDDNLFPHLVGKQPKEAAVLIPLTQIEQEWHILFTRRTDRVESHKGQVSFPGGAREQDDSDAQATALRESFEEIGLLPAHVALLGQMTQRKTISNYLVTPVIGYYESPYEFNTNRFEVQHVFTVPLRWLANRENWFTYTFDETSNIVVKYRDYDGETVWGITAKITQDLIRTLDLGY